MGPPRPIAKGHAERGFAGLPEATLESFLTARSQPVPAQDDSDVNHLVELRMACVAQTEPEWDEGRATQALNKGFLLEHPSTYDDLEVPPELIAEVMTAAEAKAVHGYSAALSQVKALHSHAQATVKKKGAKYFKPTPGAKHKPGPKKAIRWLPARQEAVSSNVAAWIDKHGPGSLTLETDDYNGRFRVIGPELNHKSVSWTLRGWRACAMQCLHLAWRFHTDHCGEPAPYDMDQLEREFSGEGAEVTG